MYIQTAIHPLDATTVRRIHSGQVIVNIEAIVKELIENALDAASTSVEVRIVNRGLDLIQVKDDGHGISKESCSLLGRQYHTSKIKCLHDLNHIQSFGFRGEALNAMCSIAEKVEITTKTLEDRLATQYTLNQSGGHVSEKPTALIARSGTIVSVYKPFVHLPVRRQLIENAYNFYSLKELMIKYGLAYPSVRFSIASITKNIRANSQWAKPVAANVIDAVALAYGRPLAQNVECHHITNGPISLDCVLPTVASDAAIVCRGNHVHVSINRRPVKYSRCELKEIAAIMRSRYNLDETPKKTPFMVVNIQLDGDQFDVNVEPDKSAVLLHHRQQVIDLFEKLVDRVYSSPVHPSLQSLSSQVPLEAATLTPREGVSTTANRCPSTGDKGVWKFTMASQDSSSSSEDQDQVLPTDDADDLQTLEANPGTPVPTLKAWFQNSKKGTEVPPVVHKEAAKSPHGTAKRSTRRQSATTPPTRKQAPLAEVSNNGEVHPFFAPTALAPPLAAMSSEELFAHIGIEPSWQVELLSPSPSSTPQQQPAILSDVQNLRKAPRYKPRTNKSKPTTTERTSTTPKKHNLLLSDKRKGQSLINTLNSEMVVKCNMSSILSNYESQRSRNEQMYRVRMDRYPSLFQQESTQDAHTLTLQTEDHRSLHIHIKTQKHGYNAKVEEIGVVDTLRMKCVNSLSWYLNHHKLIPNKRLERPIDIKLSKEDSYFKIIRQLETNEKTQIDDDKTERVYKIISDHRLVYNGFQCRWRMIDPSTMLLEITAIHHFNDDYGAADLCELLSILQQYPYIDNMSHCRPTRVQDYYRYLVSFDDLSQSFNDEMLQWEERIVDGKVFQLGACPSLEKNQIVYCSLFQTV